MSGCGSERQNGSGEGYTLTFLERYFSGIENMQKKQEVL